MTTQTVFQSDKIQSLLKRLHAEAEAADQPFMAQFEHLSDAERTAIQSDYRKLYGLAREAFIPVGEEFGRLLYLLARTSKARSIVEFGTSFGLSTIYLAAALRDNGGGKLITYEMEPTKSKRAQHHLAAAGLADLVEFQIGDALELLGRAVPAPVDFLLLDGAKQLYYDVLKLVEPHLQTGAMIAADNVNARSMTNQFTDYIRHMENGYISVDMPIEDGIELSVRLV
jgi:predicted O-methyltransferase YrrM